MRKKKELPISSFLKEEMSINRKCINLQNKAITLIDEISPFLCSEIEVLNLKNNKLTSLKGIAQFGFLKELDISFNQISNCSELKALKTLVHLKKLHFSNNPFLSEPLQQELLDIVLQKQTDIEILQLSLMKEVENEEIKIIFLKNYLNKIQLHEQLKRKQYVNDNKSKLKTQKLIDKIIPQFYTIIENQKLTSSIKREALEIKKRTNDSLQGALSQTKAKKQMKIDQLLTNIVEILHQTNNFNSSRNFMLEVNLDNSTISFSPEKQRQFKNSVKIQEDAQFSPVRYIQLSKDQNSLQEINISNSKQPKSTFAIKPQNVFSNTQETSHSVHKSPYTQISKKSPSNLDNIQTSRKNNSIGKLKSHQNNFLNQFKKYKQQNRNYQTEKTIEENKVNFNSPNRQLQSKLFNSTIKKPNQTDNNLKNQYIKVIDEHAEDMYQQKKSPNNPIKIPSLVSPAGMQSPLNWKGLTQMTDPPTPQYIQTIYYKTLPKIHPMFHLLYSPSASLTVEEKDTILQALKASHKQNFIELFKQKLSNQLLMRQIDQVNNDSIQQIQTIVQQNKEVYSENVRLRQQFQWIDNRNKSIQQQYMKLNSKFKEIELSEKNKTATIAVMDNSYKKIKESYLQKVQELQRLETYQHLQQEITRKRENRIIQSHILAIKVKSTQWKKILDMEQKAKRKREEQLYIWGFLSFEMNRNLFKDLNKLNKKHQLSVVKQYFSQWIISRDLERKQKSISRVRRKKLGFQMMEFLKINYSSSKMKKLRNIWALRLYKESRYKKSLRQWSRLVEKSRNNQTKAVDYNFLSTTKKYILSIRQLIKRRKNNIVHIQQNHNNHIRKKQFQKMVYIMKKQLIENSEKQKKLRLYYEHCFRIKGFNRIKDNTSYLIRRKSKENQIIQILGKKHITFLKKYTFLTKKKMRKLCGYVRYLKWKTVKRQLKLEKKSFNMSNFLLSKSKQIFLSLVKYNRTKEKSMSLSLNKLQIIQTQKLLVLKLKFIKWMEVLRLKGRNYIKHRVIQEMDAQMNINDTCAHQLIKQSQDELLRCQQEISFLKKQIQVLSNRQIHLLTQKDEMAISINESYEIMMELRKQIQSIRDQSKRKDENYNNLARKYNQAFALFQKTRPNP